MLLLLFFFSNIYLEKEKKKALMQLNLSVGIKNDEFLLDNTIDVFNICFYEKQVWVVKPFQHVKE